MSKPSCILLLSDHPYLSDAAEQYARLLFDVRAVERHARSDKQLTPGMRDNLDPRCHTQFLFNFLSPVILTAEQLAGIEKQAINFHPAPPKWPGVGGASLALYERDKTFGATAHIMETKVDSGPILNTIPFGIQPEETCGTLSARALHYSLALFFEVLEEITENGEAKPDSLFVPNWERPAVTRAEFERFMTVKPDDSPEEIQRKARALKHSKFPGVRLEIAGVQFVQPPEKY